MNVLQLETGVDGLFQNFARLDSRISSVGQTAAKIGDHLQVKGRSALFDMHVAIPLCMECVILRNKNIARNEILKFISCLSECRFSEGNC